MYFRSMARDTFTECYLTLPASGALPTIAEAGVLYEQMCEAILERGIQPVQEKIYGPQAEREDVLAVRETTFRKAGLDPTLPCTYLDGQPGVNSAVAGLQLWGIVPKPGGGVTVSSVLCPDSGAGRVIRGDGFEILYVPHISGRGDGDAENCAAAQGERMFRLANDAVHARGHGYAYVVRTWIYLSRILDWYGEFNRVRSDFHVGQGLDGRIDGRPFPASTAIQGGGAGEECMMDLLTVRTSEGADVRVRPVLGSRRQRNAFAYGSGFSRAVSLGIEDRQTIFVSGTASIDGEGRTVHRGEYEGQVIETLLNIAVLLEEQGARLRDIAQGTLFYKDEKMLATYQEVSHLLGLEDLPLIPVRADICRPELLVEIEAVALVAADRSRPQ
jgi:enamine deaminase RidA (YjgF/YER057c/UK114 family)